MVHLVRLYARVPAMYCQGKCQESCGPITVAAAEAARMERAGGKFRLEAGKDGEGRCGYLAEDGRCRVYEVRPLVCRLWGQTVEFPCPHGCQPARVLGKPEATMLYRTLLRLSGNRWAGPEIVGELTDRTEGADDGEDEEGGG